MEDIMEYNFLGESGIKVSNICLGTMTFGESFPLPKNSCNTTLSHEILDRYVELGGNFVDTADIYNHGLSEKIIGSWMQHRKNRENIILATKVRGNAGVTENVNNIGLSRRHITASIERSLENLRTDYVDLYQAHFWDEAVRPEEVLRTFDDLVRCGKVRYVGFSNFSGWQLQTMVETGKRLGLNPAISLQQQYNLLCRWSEFESFQACKFGGLGVLPWSPLKGGLLTGKVKRHTKPTEGRLEWVAQDTKRATAIAPAWDELEDSTFDIIEMAEKIAQEKGRSTAQVAVRWLLQKDVVSSVIIGVSKVSQLEDNIKAATGWTLTDDEMQRLDDVSKLDSPYPYSFISKLNQDRKNKFPVGQQYVQNKTL